MKKKIHTLRKEHPAWGHDKPTFQIAIDGGVSILGVSIWRDGELVKGGPIQFSKEPLIARSSYHIRSAVVAAIDEKQFDDGSEASEFFRFASEVVIEEPMVVAGWTKDPESLIQLAITVGCLIWYCESRGAKVETTKPQPWKGQLSKEITRQRVIKKLSEVEASRVELPSAAGLEHNVIDGVGIGLWAFTNR